MTLAGSSWGEKVITPKIKGLCYQLVQNITMRLYLYNYYILGVTVVIRNDLLIKIKSR